MSNTAATRYDIELCDDGRFGDECQEFCQWLNDHEHAARIHTDPYCYVDGVRLDDYEESEELKEVLNSLWEAYCKDE